VIDADGTLSGDVVLVGRGDPNLSNRRFPFQSKEEFDGVPERALSEMADRHCRAWCKSNFWRYRRRTIVIFPPNGIQRLGD